MGHIHVCLVSDQPIPNLTTVLQFKPDTVALLSTKDKQSQAERLERVVKTKGAQVRTVEIQPYDMNNVIGVCEDLIRQCGDCEVSLNITGGTKIGTIGSFQAFYTLGKPIYYVNTRDHEILNVSPQEIRIPIQASISIKDYLAVYGFNVDKYVKDDAFMYARRHVAEALAHLAVKRPGLIGTINWSFPENIEKASYPLTVTLPADPDLNRLSNAIETGRFGRRQGKTGLLINSLDDARYLRGMWLEEYVYMAVKDLAPDEVKINVEGTWDAVGKYQPKNEFDVLVAKGNRLFYISCKTSNPDRKISDNEESIGKEYLYELDSIGDNALGLFGKRMLVSARPINNEYVRKRASVLDIKIIDGKNLATLKENLRQWISK